MKNLNIIFAGFGGQGVLFAGKVTAYAALISGKEVSWLPSYGPEMRGGTANCSVCVSDSQIGSPLIVTPNVLVAMNQPSFDKFIGSVEKGGTVIVDSSLVDPKTERGDINLFKIDATNLSSDGLKGLANIILLGKLFSVTDVFDAGTVEKAINKSIPQRKAHLAEGNMKAIRLGASL